MYNYQLRHSIGLIVFYFEKKKKKKFTLSLNEYE